MELQEKSVSGTMPMLPQPLTAPLPPTKDSGSRVHQYLATIAVCCGAMSGGCGLGWTSPALPMLAGDDYDDSILGYKLSSNQSMWVGALLALGALFGAVPGGLLSERFGRRLVLLVLSAPLILSWVLTAVATGLGAIYAARFIIGVSIGAISAVAPVYVGEIASADLRGTLGSSFQLMLVTGVLYVYAVGAFASFRVIAWASGVPAVLMLAGVFMFVPESPTYAVRKGNEAVARRSLRRLRGAGADIETPLQELRDAAAAGPPGSFSTVVASPVRRKALSISLLLMFFQQMSGINAIIFYTKDIFQSAGSSLHPDVCSCLSGATMVVATVASGALVERAGRRVLLLLSAAVMAVCLLILGLCFKMPNSTPGWLALFAVVLYLVVFSLGFGPLPWSMIGELFAPEIKGAAGGLAAAGNWLVVFIVTLTFVPAQDALGGAVVFWFFSVVCIVATVYVFFVVPETKGKGMQQIQDELAGIRGPRSAA